MAQNLAQEQLCPRVLRIIKKRLWSVLFNNLALIHKNYTVGDLTGKPHLMGHTDHRHAFFGQLDHRIEHFFDHFGIKCRSRLVKQHNPRLHAQ